jgi:hypothetical protein
VLCNEDASEDGRAQVCQFEDTYLWLWLAVAGCGWQWLEEENAFTSTQLQSALDARL